METARPRALLRSPAEARPLSREQRRIGKPKCRHVSLKERAFSPPTIKWFNPAADVSAEGGHLGLFSYCGLCRSPRIALRAVDTACCRNDCGCLDHPRIHRERASAGGGERRPSKSSVRSGVHAFAVELATNDTERSQGLMFRKKLPDGRGMLFDFEQDRPVAFRMRNIYLSLDMVFIAGNGRILRIAERTKPLSDRLIPSGGRFAPCSK